MLFVKYYWKFHIDRAEVGGVAGKHGRRYRMLGGKS
jgi:hypothetical protein